VQLLITTIITPSYTLRSLDPTRDDLTNYLSWMRDEDSNSFIESVNRNYSLEKLTEFIDSKNHSVDCILLGIFTSSEQLHIGNLKFESISKKEKRAVLGMLIGDLKSRGKGIGTQILPFAFLKMRKEFGIEIIELGVNSENHPALSLYKKVGFEIVSPYGEGGFWMRKLIIETHD